MKNKKKHDQSQDLCKSGQLVPGKLRLIGRYRPVTSGILGLLVGSGSDERGLSGVSGRIRRIAPDRGPGIGNLGTQDRRPLGLWDGLVKIK